MEIANTLNLQDRMVLQSDKEIDGPQSYQDSMKLLEPYKIIIQNKQYSNH